MVLNMLPPSDLDAFGALCKRFRQLASSHLGKHLQLKLKYTSCNYYSDYGENGVGGDGPPAHLLKQVLSNPSITEYIKNLHLKDMKDFGASFQADKDTISQFRDGIRDCKLIFGT